MIDNHALLERSSHKSTRCGERLEPSWNDGNQTIHSQGTLSGVERSSLTNLAEICWKASTPAPLSYLPNSANSVHQDVFLAKAFGISDMNPFLGEKIDFSGGRLQDPFVLRDKISPAASTTTKNSTIAYHTKFAHSLHYVK